MSFWRVIGKNFLSVEVEAPTVVDAVAEAVDQKEVKLEAIEEVIQITAPGWRPANPPPPNKYVPIAYGIGPVGGGEFKHGPFNHLEECLNIYPQMGDAIIQLDLEGKQHIWATCVNGEWKAEKEN